MRRVYVVISYDILQLQTIESVFIEQSDADAYVEKITQEPDVAYACVYVSKLIGLDPERASCCGGKDGQEENGSESAECCGQCNEGSVR